MVLATLFISISNSLPRTSYVKLIDVYLIFNLIVPFLEIILQTTLDILDEEQEEEEPQAFIKKRTSRGKRGRGQRKIKLRKMLQPATRYGLPIAYFSFIVIFFFFGAISDIMV